MFYSFIRGIIRLLVYVLNGKPIYQNKQVIPKNDTYILAAPHRTWLDPVFLALAASPDKFSFMAKKELFKNPILRWLITNMNAFPVDRKNPGPSAIKTPVKWLKEGELNLIIFPSGSRHSEEMKGGTLTIAKLSGKAIIPAVFEGPRTFKELLQRKQSIVRFGEPLVIERKVRLDKETVQVYGDILQKRFETIDEELLNEKIS